MNSRLIELAEKRGELKARSAMQREALAQHVWPVEDALAMADRAVDGVRWLQRHPVAVAGAVLAMVIIQPKRVWRWTRRGYVAWRGVQKVRGRLQAVTRARPW